jgi:hypothetical protein
MTESFRRMKVKEEQQQQQGGLLEIWTGDVGMLMFVLQMRLCPSGWLAISMPRLHSCAQLKSHHRDYETDFAQDHGYLLR